MKKVSYISFLYLLVLAFTNCQNDDQTLLPSKKESIITTITSPYKISKSEALKNLREVMLSLEEKRKLRSSEENPMRDIALKLQEADLKPIQIGTSSALTRSPKEDSEKLYLVNFLDDRGYAIVSADKRLPDAVLCIAEKGDLTVEDIQNNLEPEVTIDEIQKQVPNFKYYNPDTQEYYVGRERSESLQKHSNRMLMHYVDRYVDEYTASGGTYGPTIKTYDNPKTIEEVPALLNTKWHQRWPFNDQYPYYRKFILVGNEAQAPAGCVPVALGQILAHNEFPQNYLCNGIKINWQEVKKVYPHDYIRTGWTFRNITDSQRLMTGSFLRCISGSIGAITTYWFTFATPGSAATYMKNCGYKNVQLKWGQHEEHVKAMLRAKKPVFMSGVSGVTNGHAWVIDGYRAQEQRVTEKRHDGKIVSIHNETRFLYHCNFGWGGRADGYYASGLYAPRYGAVERDAKDKGYSQRNDQHYKWGFNIITYDY